MTFTRASTRVPRASRTRRSAAALVTAVIAVSLGAGVTAIAPVAAQTMAGDLKTCGDVTGDTWTFPGPNEPSGDAYVVLAENVPCSRARSIGAYMALGGAGFKGWKCARHKHFNGGCGRFVRRPHPRTRQFVAWYADLAHPNGP
jgi:hypothetical protein